MPGLFSQGGQGMPTGQPQTFAEFVSLLLSIISLIIPLIFAVTFLVMAWKIVDAWILHADDPTKISEGKKTVIIGIIVLVVMSGIWGILALLRRSLFGI